MEGAACETPEKTDPASQIVAGKEVILQPQEGGTAKKYEIRDVVTPAKGGIPRILGEYPNQRASKRQRTPP